MVGEKQKQLQNDTKLRRLLVLRLLLLCNQHNDKATCCYQDVFSFTLACFHSHQHQTHRMKQRNFYSLLVMSIVHNDCVQVAEFTLYACHTPSSKTLTTTPHTTTVQTSSELDARKSVCVRGRAHASSAYRTTIQRKTSFYT